MSHLDLTNEPYYDDFSDENNFYRVLFKPGRAVQARELNQLQTILADQIAKFGNHIFKEGSLVLPGSIHIDRNFNYVQLEALYSGSAIDTSLFVEREVQGQTTGIKAKVITHAAAEGTDPPTIFVKYLNSGTDKVTKTFAAAEVIESVDTGTKLYATVGSARFGGGLTPTGTIDSPTGKCIGAIFSKGVFFVRGSFVTVATQMIVLDKYTDDSTYKIGLQIQETLVTSDDDETLLDPALTSSNYLAPGADRLKISGTLVAIDIDEVTSAENFIELIRVREGKVEYKLLHPSYNILADELARRTYDESGDYVVDPFKLNIIEHLRSNTNPTGYLYVADGGDSSKAIATLTTGKAYVKGYEVATSTQSYLTFNKPRDASNVLNSTILTPYGNYVEVTGANSIPNFTTDLQVINLYNRYTTASGSPAGTLVGNAKIRGLETSGNVMLDATTYKAFIFDVEMISGYTFERDVKQLTQPAVSSPGTYVSTAYTANVVPQSIAITGTTTLVNNSSNVAGVNSIFVADLKANDYVRFTTDTANVYRVSAVLSQTEINIDPVYPLANIAGVNMTRDGAVIVDSNKTKLVYEISSNVIKTLTDPTFQTRRVYYRTLSSSATTINLGVNETFTSTTSIFGVNSATGKLYTPTTSGTATSLTIDFSGHTGLSSADMLIYTTIRKTTAEKQKTAVSGTVTYTAKEDCQASKISLNTADVYRITAVKMSANAFGTAYTTTNIIDITDRFVLLDGQTPAYYGISKVQLKPGAPVPTGPIRIFYDYFTHGAGDYFTADSYPNYEDIPQFKDQGVTYNLRNCIDFRPRKDNTGTNFKDTGSSRNEFIDYSNDFQADYEFYLPRIDKIYVDKTGEIRYVEGASASVPVEPSIPVDTMPLYRIEHPAYGFDIKKDSTFEPLYQKRYTMRDIGKLETRIKNLEYYTTLSLLELDTAVFSIKDQFGLERYKNGFIVEPFKGHSIGDTQSIDYDNSMDFKTGTLKPPFKQNSVQLSEINSVNAARTANGYIRVNDVIMLDYDEEEFISSTNVSENESITPYDDYTFIGRVSLTPSVDRWWETGIEPVVLQDEEGRYDTLISDAVGSRLYGTVWESWKTLYFNNDQETAKWDENKNGLVITDSNYSSEPPVVVLPYMRSTSFKFEATGLKPDTAYYAFFADYNVTEWCIMPNFVTDVNDNANTNAANVLYSSNTGVIIGTLNFDVESTGIRIPTGQIKFRLADVSTDGFGKESFAEAYFTSEGLLGKSTSVSTNNYEYSGAGQFATDTDVAPGWSHFLAAAITGTWNPANASSAVVEKIAASIRAGIGETEFLNIGNNILTDSARAVIRSNLIAGVLNKMVGAGEIDPRLAPDISADVFYASEAEGNYLWTVGSTMTVWSADNIQDLFDDINSAPNGSAVWDYGVAVYDAAVDTLTDSWDGFVSANEGVTGQARIDAAVAQFGEGPVNGFFEAVASGKIENNPEGVAAFIQSMAIDTAVGAVSGSSNFASDAAGKTTLN